MASCIVAVVMAALAPNIEAKMRERVPPTLSIPKIIHEPFDVKPIPGAPQTDTAKERKS